MSEERRALGTAMGQGGPGLVLLSLGTTGHKGQHHLLMLTEGGAITLTSGGGPPGTRVSIIC